MKISLGFCVLIGLALLAGGFFSSKESLEQGDGDASSVAGAAFDRGVDHLVGPAEHGLRHVSDISGGDRGPEWSGTRADLTRTRESLHEDRTGGPTPSRIPEKITPGADVLRLALDMSGFEKQRMEIEEALGAHRTRSRSDLLAMYGRSSAACGNFDRAAACYILFLQELGLERFH